jgi:hypothetical protein
MSGVLKPGLLKIPTAPDGVAELRPPFCLSWWRGEFPRARF